MKQKIKLLFAGIFACVWWFLFYPELCFPDGTYEAAYQESICEEIFPEEIEKLLQADDEHIIVKSRLLEVWKQLQN